MLCALVTEDFVRSQWTDQEVGFALGRGVPVVALACGAPPYGLLGKQQALRVDLAKISASASAVANIVAEQEALQGRLIEGLVDSLRHAVSFQRAKDTMKLLGNLSRHLSNRHILTMLEAIRDNSQVADAHGVAAHIRRISAARKVSLPEPARGPADDDIPF